MSKPTLLLLKGLPCSGKTEFARNWADRSDRIRVSWSDILDMLGERFRKERRVIAVDTAIRAMCVALKEGKSVVLDECNLHGSSFGIFLGRAQQLGARIVWHNMEQCADECKRRNAQYGHPVDDILIDYLAEKYSVWLKA